MSLYGDAVCAGGSGSKYSIVMFYSFYKKAIRFGWLFTYIPCNTRQ